MPHRTRSQPSTSRPSPGRRGRPPTSVGTGSSPLSPTAGTCRSSICTPVRPTRRCCSARSSKTAAPSRALARTASSGCSDHCWEPPWPVRVKRARRRTPADEARSSRMSRRTARGAHGGRTVAALRLRRCRRYRDSRSAFAGRGPVRVSHAAPFFPFTRGRAGTAPYWLRRAPGRSGVTPDRPCGASANRAPTAPSTNHWSGRAASRNNAGVWLRRPGACEQPADNTAGDPSPASMDRQVESFDNTRVSKPAGLAWPLQRRRPQLSPPQRHSMHECSGAWTRRL